MLAACGLVLALMLALPPLLGFTVDITSFWAIFAFATVFGIFIPYAYWRGLDRLVPGLEATTAGLVAMLPIITLTYAAMRLNMPLADPTLARMDRAVGFDWAAFAGFVNDHASLAAVLDFAYRTFGPQLILLPMLLGLFGLAARAYQLIFGWILLCIVSSVISIFFPSIGANAAYGFTDASLQNLDPHLSRGFLTSFFDARERADFVLGVENASGIITFPSVHAGVAALCAWAAWPSRTLRVPFLLLNIGMAVAAISHGAHYLVDILAGTGIAAATIMFTLWATESRALARERVAGPAVPHEA